MCIFCAATPAAAALGAMANAKQRTAQSEARLSGKAGPKPRFPAAKITPVVVLALMAASAVYHLHQPV